MKDQLNYKCLFSGYKKTQSDDQLQTSSIGLLPGDKNMRGDIAVLSIPRTPLEGKPLI